MEPVTTAAITTLVTFLGQQGFEAVFEMSVQEATRGSFKWIKSFLFKEDGKPKEVLEKYQLDPNSSGKQKALEGAIETELEDNPNAKNYLLELVKAIEAKPSNISNISKSKNVNTGTIKTGGTIIIGDNNNPSK